MKFIIYSCTYREGKMSDFFVMWLQKINKVQTAKTSFFKGHFVTFKEGQIQGVRIYVNSSYIWIYFEL